MTMIGRLSDRFLRLVVPATVATAEPGCCCGGRCDYHGGPPKWRYCCASGPGWVCDCTTFNCN